jgi:hypothetical protein
VESVNAYPTKQFFLEMFTRDISLEDCILDLIDNSIDSLIKTKKIDIEAQVFGSSNGASTGPASNIRVTFDKNHFRIEDDCGGIPRHDAETDVFCFGHSAKSHPTGRLGVYGIGLKRALFKLGDFIEVESYRPEGNFKVTIDVSVWANTPNDDLNTWRFPIANLGGSTPAHSGRTVIKITKLHKAAITRIEAGSLATSLPRTVAQAYSVFLGKHVRISINKTIVPGRPIPFGGSAEMNRAETNSNSMA